MFKTWCIYIAALIGTFIFFLVYKMWVSWYCLMLLLLLPAASFIMLKIASDSIDFKTEVPGLLNIGDKANIKITINGKAANLSYVKFTAVITDRMTDEKKTTLYSVFDRGMTKLPIDTSHCGAFVYKITDLRIYDLFGFFFVRRMADKTCEVLVRPVPCMPGFMPNSMGIKARLLRKAKNPMSEIYDIRDYAQGDPIKSIHWKMSAKKDKLIVREPLEEYAGHSRVLLKLTPDRKEMDVHLGEMLFTSTYFLKHDTTHKIRVIPPNKCEVAYDIESEADLQKAMASILRTKLPKEDAYAD